MFHSELARVRNKLSMFLMTPMYFLDKQEAYATKKCKWKKKAEQGERQIIDIMKKLVQVVFQIIL